MARELDAKLWSTLPTELMDRVLQHLPISSLCKFRAVCKHWSTLPTVSAEDPYYLCFPEMDLRFGHERRCKVYSFTRNQWEDLDLSFLAPLVAQHCLGQESYGIIMLNSSCSDGGLLFLDGTISRSYSDNDDNDEKSFRVVCNPLTRTAKFVDGFHPNETGDYLIYRNPSSGVYRIFVGTYHEHDHCYYMYDSKSEVWVLLLTLKGSGVEVNMCSIVFNDVYYIFCGGGKYAYKLFAYNFNEHELLEGGSMTGLPSSIRSVSFVVSNNCLLLLAKTTGKRTLVYRIDEMKLSRLDGSEVIKLPRVPDWYKAYGYGEFILLVNEDKRDFTIVDIADPEAVKTRAVPKFPPRLSSTMRAASSFPTNFSVSNPTYERVTFNLHAKV